MFTKKICPRTLRVLFSALCVLSFQLQAGESTIRPVHLRCEYRVSPHGIDELHPRLSWILHPSSPSARNERQTAYHILVATSPLKLQEGIGDLWDTGVVESDDSVHVVYNGKPLSSGLRCWWKVRVRDGAGRWSPWSETAFWSMGLLKPEDWHGKWIGLKSEIPKQPSPLSKASWIWFPEKLKAPQAPPGDRFFRLTFNVPENREARRAEFYVTADNSFNLFVNGKPCGKGSSFMQLYAFDIAVHLHPGRNVLALKASNAGEKPNPAGLIGVLKIEFAEGAPLEIPTGGGWKSSARAAGDWTKEDFDDSGWTQAALLGPYGMDPWGEVAKPENRELPARYLRKEFTLRKKPERAVAYVSGLGLFEFMVNGKKVGDQVLVPALTQYDKRVLYLTFEIGDLLRRGRNCVGVVLGNGRYFAPRLRVPTKTVTFGLPKLLFELRVEYGDGTSTLLYSDGSWTVTDRGPIRANNEYDGEFYDARLDLGQWSEPGYDDSKWKFADILPAPGGTLRSQMSEPIRVTETLKPVLLSNPRAGLYIYDIGQNIVGWCRIKVQGPRGARVSLRHAERLTPEGLLYVDNLRSAKAQDVYILSGEGVETYEPRFTYHGFRYVEVSGYPEEVTLRSLEAKVVHDDLEPAGSFACSDRLLDRIHRNIRWGVRGNYRSIPTDCPQRDERQGWLGDRSAESLGETYLFDVAAFYSKWLIDIQDCQKPTGSIPDVAPAYWPFYNDNVTWPSSYIIIPGHLYRQYGDRRVLERHFDSMKKWITYMSGFVKDGIIDKDNYGDWCVPPEEPHLIHSRDPSRKTPGDFLATAYFYHDLRLMARYASILGKKKESARFLRKAEEIRKAFNKRFYRKAEGIYANGSQTSCVLPLALGLVPPEGRKRLFERLVEKIEKESRRHIGTGLIGAQWLMEVLTEGGRVDLAYAIATQKTYPSWGYMIERGATTIWELWNGDTADPAMNSGNHVMLVGDLLTWLYGDIAGVRSDPNAPGFKRSVIRPHPAGDLQWAKASCLTPYGTVYSAWRIEGDKFHLNVTVPVNTKALVYVPSTGKENVTESGKAAENARGVRFVRMEKPYAVFEIGSGAYHFVSTRFKE